MRVARQEGGGGGAPGDGNALGREMKMALRGMVGWGPDGSPSLDPSSADATLALA